ncbi:hypothetical protein D3C85_1163270 [compost metagenome]
MDTAGARYRPVRCRAFEQRTALAHVAAVEDILLAIDGGDDVEDSDFVRGPGQFETAAHTFGGDHQLGLGQLGEDFGQVFMGHALQFGQVAHARLAAIAQIVYQEKQAVDAVLNAGAIEGHVKLRLYQSY